MRRKQLLIVAMVVALPTLAMAQSQLQTQPTIPQTQRPLRPLPKATAVPMTISRADPVIASARTAGQAHGAIAAQRRVTVKPGVGVRQVPAQTLADGVRLTPAQMLAARGSASVKMLRVPDEYVTDRVTDRHAPWTVTTYAPNPTNMIMSYSTVYRVFERAPATEPCPRTPYVEILTPGMTRHGFVYEFPSLSAPGVYRLISPSESGYKQVHTNVNWGHNHHRTYQPWSSKQNGTEVRTGREYISIWVSTIYEKVVLDRMVPKFKCFIGVEANLNVRGPNGVDPIAGRYFRTGRRNPSIEVVG